MVNFHGTTKRPRVLLKLTEYANIGDEFMGRRPWVNYHHLLYFKTIAMEGGIAKAAKKLRLGQPTLSTQIKQFEDAIGHTLFDRTNRRLTLTEAGQLVLGYAQEIFRLGDEMVDSLTDHHTGTKLHIQFGAADSVSHQYSLQLITYAKANQECQVTMMEGSLEDLLRELKAHRIDLALTNEPPPVTEAQTFYSRCIARFPVVICGAAGSSDLKKQFPESLRDKDFILPSTKSKLRQDFNHSMNLTGIEFRTVAEVQSRSLQILLATKGEGLVPLPLPQAEEAVQQKSLFMIGTIPNLYEELWLIAAERRIQNPLASQLMRSFKLT